MGPMFRPSPRHLESCRPDCSAARGPSCQGRRLPRERPHRLGLLQRWLHRLQLRPCRSRPGLPQAMLDTSRLCLVHVMGGSP
eukprot:2092589-Alexandrium_andersonii.AAC.1